MSAVLLVEWGIGMGFGIRNVSLAVVAGIVLATAACSSSGTVAASAAHSSAKSTSAASTGAKTAAPSSAASSTSAAPSTDSSSGSSGTALSSDQLSKNMLTDKDAPGYTYDASQDDTTLSDTPDTVTSGGSACQRFVDAQNAATPKYDTSAEVSRALTKTAEQHVIQDVVMAFPSSEKAAAVVSDATTGLQGCKSLKLTIDGGSGTMVPAVIPQLVHDGQLGYINYLTMKGKTVIMAADEVHVGQAVSIVVLVSAPTNDKPTLEKMGATMAHLSDIQVARLKKAQGLG